MSRVLFRFLFCLLLCNTVFAETYYFNECRIGENASGNYLIDFDKNEIIVSLKSTDGSSQELIDKIEVVTKDRVVSERIQNKTKKQFYLQYQLDANSKTISRQHYKKEVGIDLIRPFGPKRESYCADVKADWDKNKIENSKINKKEEQILKTQKQISDKQSSVPECLGNDYKQWTNCKGTRRSESGSQYMGQFKNGEIIEGTAIYPGEAKYVGHFKDGKPHGQGTFEYSDGSKYYGEWKDGQNYGNGTKIWKDGKKYSGQFKDDKPHGQGTFEYSDGSKYVGQIKDGKRHGDGTLTYSDGNTYIGQFVSGSEHGKGSCINPEGSNIECKLLKKGNTKDSANINRRTISIEARKWVLLDEYESLSGKGKIVIKKLENSLNKRAAEVCSTYGSFKIINKKIVVLEIDETPAFGLEPKAKLAINGVIQCG